jgi:hypothetical protein
MFYVTKIYIILKIKNVATCFGPTGSNRMFKYNIIKHNISALKPDVKSSGCPLVFVAHSYTLGRNIVTYQEVWIKIFALAEIPDLDLGV